jgi:protein TonB
VVGVVGLSVPYARPGPTALQPPPVVAEVLSVELTDDPLPEPDGGAPAAGNFAQPPPANAVVQPFDAPPMIAVAAPSPAIAFALPVEGPAKIVEPKQAAYFQPSANQTATDANAQGNGVGSGGYGAGLGGNAESLNFGRGDGRQPKPEYPRRARLEGQEGTVVVRFSVGENGRVVAAEAVVPSAWPLLNEEALRTIRERWRFRAGAVRVYEVSIRFQLED